MRVSFSLKLGFQVVVSCLTRILGAKLSALNHRAVCPAPRHFVLDIFFFVCVCVHGAEDQTSIILCMLDKQSTFEVHPKSLMF